VECAHWHSAGKVGQFIERQGIASMLAFDADRYLRQLYLTEYDPDFIEPDGWYGNRPWADFHSAQPVDPRRRFLTLGCYHVGWLPNGRDRSLQGRGIGTALLCGTIDWLSDRQDFDGLLTWARQPGSRQLLLEAGQMSHTVYLRFGFQEIKQVRDAVWVNGVIAEKYPGATEKEP
jgi:GNAT superfamily N-acetyltransferase